MTGHFSEDALQQFSEMASNLFPQDFSESDTYDFTRCVRPDGSSYGTGGSCRKGTEQAKQHDEKSTPKKSAAPMPNSRWADYKALAKEGIMHPDMANHFYKLKSKEELNWENQRRAEGKVIKEGEEIPRSEPRVTFYEPGTGKMKTGNFVMQDGAHAVIRDDNGTSHRFNIAAAHPNVKMYGDETLPLRKSIAKLSRTLHHETANNEFRGRYKEIQNEILDKLVQLHPELKKAREHMSGFKSKSKEGEKIDWDNYRKGEAVEREFLRAKQAVHDSLAKNPEHYRWNTKNKNRNTWWYN